MWHSSYKLIILAGILFTFSISKAQLYQTLGAAYGLTYGGYALNNKDLYRQDVSLRYNLNYIRFLVKAGLGIRPNTYFGTQYTGTLQLGYTMPLYKTISLFVSSGIYLSDASDRERSDIKYGGTTVSSSLGLHYRPIKEQPLILGLEAISFQEWVSTSIRGWGYSYKNWPVNAAFSINYLIGKSE